MIFQSAKVKRLEKEVEQLTNDAAIQWEFFMEHMATTKRLAERNLKLHDELLEMTECRDAVSAASKFLCDRCDMQDAVLKMIAVYGEKHPECCVRIAKAAVDSLDNG